MTTGKHKILTGHYGELLSLHLCLCSSIHVAYVLGLIVTFAVMLLSGMGQPALLYLVPFTLIASAVVAGYRKEMRQFWAGTTYEVREFNTFLNRFP